MAIKKSEVAGGGDNAPAFVKRSFAEYIFNILLTWTLVLPLFILVSIVFAILLGFGVSVVSDAYQWGKSLWT